MEQTEFCHYLERVYKSAVSGQPMSAKAARDCMSRLRRIERILGMPITDADLSPDGIEQVIVRIRKKTANQEAPRNFIFQCVSTLRRCADFRSSRRA